MASTKGMKYAAFIDQMLQHCAMDDIGGTLVTEEKRSVPRKSVCEFGWVAALPELSRTENYFHVKYIPERSDSQRREDADDQQKSGANRGQNIFHRPANSGVYALVCHLEISRIGYNDITQEYAISPEERQKRLGLLLESVMYTFLELNGAMRSTQLPHLVALEGFLCTSASAIPAPLVSPLIGGQGQPLEYHEQAQKIVKVLNGSGPERVKLHTFDSLSAFAGQMRQLIDRSAPQALAL